MTARHSRLTILGCGTSTGVPLIGCGCAVCRSSDPRNKRSRTSAMLTTSDGMNILFDIAPDFRSQMLATGLDHVDAVLFTHLHADHCHGIDDLRAIFFKSLRPVECWVDPIHRDEFNSRFAYIVSPSGYEGVKPQITLNTIPDGAFHVGSRVIHHETLAHGRSARVKAFRVGRFAYATDFKEFPDEVIARWKGHIDTMVASGLQWLPHDTHSTVEQTVELMRRLEVRRGILTHMNHDVDYEDAVARLPSFITPAWDGMTIDIE